MRGAACHIAGACQAGRADTLQVQAATAAAAFRALAALATGVQDRRDSARNSLTHGSGQADRADTLWAQATATHGHQSRRTRQGRARQMAQMYSGSTSSSPMPDDAIDSLLSVYVGVAQLPRSGPPSAPACAVRPAGLL